MGETTINISSNNGNRTNFSKKNHKKKFPSEMKVRGCANLHGIRRRGFPIGAGRALAKTFTFNHKHII